MSNQKGLSVRDLLKETYAKLSNRHNPKEIVFPQRVLTEIADDSDWHRTRTGEMSYERAGLFTLDKKIWLIARGEKCGSYPADPYDSDLLALEFPIKKRTSGQIQEELKTEIEKSSYFRNSLIYGMADGNLAVMASGRFGSQVSYRIGPVASSYIEKPAEYDDRYLSLSTLSPVNTSEMRYKPEFTDFLANTIEAVLKEN